MKKEWTAPEISCLDVRETNNRYAGIGRDASWESLHDQDPLFGTSTGDMSMEEYFDSLP